MVRLLFVVLSLASTLGGAASATVLDQGEGTFRVQLEVTGDPALAVVAHVIDPGSDQQTIALAEVSSGVYQGVFEGRAADMLVVFENVNTGEQTAPRSLSDLGVVFQAEPATVTVPAPSTARDNRYGWLAVALGAASLSLLAFWVLGGRDEGGDETSPPDAAESPER